MNCRYSNFFLFDCDDSVFRSPEYLYITYAVEYRGGTPAENLDSSHTSLSRPASTGADDGLAVNLLRVLHLIL